MNDYESRRLQRIERNRALLAELDIKPLATSSSSSSSGRDKAPPAKRRKVAHEPTRPSRTSARIAAAPARPRYDDDGPDVRAVALPRSKSVKAKGHLGSQFEAKDEPLVPVKDVDEIQKGWSEWKPTASSQPTRDGTNGRLSIPDRLDFTPNKSPEEMLREGCFGGSYYRPLRSRKLGIVVEGDWREVPPRWIDGLNVERFLISPVYDPDVNKFKVACGQSIEEWEAAGWINHEHDVRGWFQWYTRFYSGRRCDDDDRQISRWRKCVGETGRWRRMLLKKYLQLGVREVFDDGADDETPEVSPVMHQTCHHWAYEVRQGDLDAAWAGR